jgi:hypothetical protein
MSETVQKHLDKANSAWQELAITFGGRRRRTMICGMLRFLSSQPPCSITQETLPQPALALSLEAPSE